MSDHAETDKVALVDYWLSRMIFDLSRDPATIAAWRKDRNTVMDRYPLRPEIREAVLADDMKILTRHVNAYLLRFYFGVCGMSEPDLLERLHALSRSRNHDCA
jgi:Aromatic-ring-opening dioxygenase LigAB, LigA subunit